MTAKYQVKEAIIYSEVKRALKKGLVGKLTSVEFNRWCIEWWLKSGFFNKERFKVFINYIFDAYDKRIKDGIFSLESDDNITEDDNSSYDFVEELDSSEEFEELMNEDLHNIPKIITGRWLEQQLLDRNSRFRYLGFGFSDLTNHEFEV